MRPPVGVGETGFGTTVELIVLSVSTPRRSRCQLGLDLLAFASDGGMVVGAFVTLTPWLEKHTVALWVRTLSYKQGSGGRCFAAVAEFYRRHHLFLL